MIGDESNRGKRIFKALLTTLQQVAPADLKQREIEAKQIARIEEEKARIKREMENERREAILRSERERRSMLCSHSEGISIYYKPVILTDQQAETIRQQQLNDMQE